MKTTTIIETDEERAALKCIMEKYHLPNLTAARRFALLLFAEQNCLPSADKRADSPPPKRLSSKK